jgi:hypothetical protein
MSKFRVIDGPLQVTDAGSEVSFGPFTEGGTYDCSEVFTDEYKKSIGKNWLKAGKIELIGD